MTTPSLERTYQWDTTPITIQIRLQPAQADQARSVLITATSYDDFPIAVLVDETELGELPPAVQALLAQLQQDLPVRQLRYQQTQKKVKPKSPSPARAASSAPQIAPPTANDTPTQISLF